MRRFYLIGNPLEHSFSPAYFRQKFKDEGLSGCSYEAMALSDLTDFRAWALSQEDLVGINVTVPYKIEILQYLDETDPMAQSVGAVNTVLKKGNKLVGFNTDVIGFRQSLLNTNRKDKMAIVLGTGGASKAVCFALDELGIEYLQVSRQKKISGIEYSEITKAIMETSTLIVNCTPIGMFPNVNGFPDIPYHWLTRNHLCYDLVYNPAETAFMKKSADRGAMVKNGYEMLLRQAEASWAIWEMG